MWHERRLGRGRIAICRQQRCQSIGLVNGYYLPGGMALPPPYSIPFTIKWIFSISDGIWHCKNWILIKWTMTISCGNSIEIRNMKFRQPNGPFVKSPKNTVQLPQANWSKWSHGVRAIRLSFIRCEHTHEWLPISIGIRRHHIYWPAAQLIRSHIYGIYVIRRNRWCH